MTDATVGVVGAHACVHCQTSFLFRVDCEWNGPEPVEIFLEDNHGDKITVERLRALIAADCAFAKYLYRELERETQDLPDDAELGVLYIVQQLKHIYVGEKWKPLAKAGFYCMVDADHILAPYMYPRLPALDPSSKEAFVLANERIKDCVQNHEDCSKPNTGFMPKRVLQIPPGEKVYLKQYISPAPYAALSYCWGLDKQGTVLTRSLIDKLQEGISLESLAQTIRDAIRVCRELGVEYLWVDALCIIQDDPDDKAIEIDQMGLVYENSLVTILANRAHDAAEGFLGNREPIDARLVPSFQIPCQMSSGARSHVTLIDKSLEVQYADPLIDRAWAFQEFVLPPRLLCYSKLGSEFFCPELAISILGNGFYPDRQESLGALRYGGPFHPTHILPQLSTDQLVGVWKSVITIYTRKALSNPEDRLPGLAGLAERVASLFEDEYLAGFWKADIAQYLSWHSVVEGFELLDYAIKAKTGSTIFGSVTSGCLKIKAPTLPGGYASNMVMNIGRLPFPVTVHLDAEEQYSGPIKGLCVNWGFEPKSINGLLVCGSEDSCSRIGHFQLEASQEYDEDWVQDLPVGIFITMPPKKVEAVTDNVVAFGRVRKNLKMGCVGLPNVGKSSLFNLLTEQSAAAENYPFCTIEPNEARCAVPDARYDFLCDLWKPPSMYPAYLQVTDIAGLIKGAAQGEGLGNAFLSHIQAVDGIFHIVRAFDNDQVLHVDDSIDPVRDLNTIQSELCKKDLDILQKTIVAEELIVKKAGGKYKMLPLFTETTNKIRAMLEKDQPVRDGSWTPAEIALINEKIQLITTKPVIYLVNLTMKDYLRQKSKYLPLIAKWVTEHGGVPRDIVPFSIEFEEKLYSMKDDPAAQAEFLKESKVKSRLDKIITEGFTKLGEFRADLNVAGEKEIRCWTIPRGCFAPQAAGAIHSDFERGFIKAEVVAYQDFHDLCEGNKSMGPIKAAGKYRQEGKSYVGTQTPPDAAAAHLIFSQVVQDGDIIHFQFNVSNKK
ncbi:GTP-binding [Fusarium albosuccineum]|uniref:GTP-binding n=1 Tax=Fusarium albosuccineum TaxID=1237068 RepID=A0A8H4L8G0_9HYPO|nr:GTP-binding [Fusarium albosuccineum]